MKQYVVIYTDGACAGNPGTGGWAAIIKYDGSKEIGSIIARHDGYIIADIYDAEKWLAIKNMIDSGKIKAYPSKCSFGILSFKLGPAILGLICDELNELLD